jgi:Flp pilus assembly protein TadG
MKSHPQRRSLLGWASPRRRRRAVAAVEFAVVAPFLVMLILGIIEFGRLIMLQQIVTNASREGARRAIVEAASVGEVQTIVSEYLTNAGVSDETIVITPDTLVALGLGDPVSVEVTVPYGPNSWLPAPWFLGGTTLSAESIMRAERPQ